MADVPDSKTYQYAGDHHVSPGDPTEAADDYNRAADNTDHLRESKPWSWKGTNYEGGARVMETCGGGFHWIGNVFEDSVAISVVAASTLKIPLDVDMANGEDSSWLKYRYLSIEYYIAILTAASPTADAQNLLPGGDYEEYLATDYDSTYGHDAPGPYSAGEDFSHSGPHRVAFYSGPGMASYSGKYRGRTTISSPLVTPGPEEDVEVIFYVAEADDGDINDGDLVCRISCNTGYSFPIVFAIHGVVKWGPLWAESA